MDISTFDNFDLLIAIILFILILLSAFFSSSETSLMAINQIKLDNAEEKGSISAKRVNSLRAKITEVLGVILIGNNLVNISASALLTYYIISKFGDQYVWAGTLILTIVVIIFAEIAPKNYATKQPESIAYPASKPLEILTNIIGWFAKILTSIGNLITGTNSDENYFSQNLNRDELKSVLQKDTEQVDEDEMIALKSLLELNELTVEDILIPIQEVISININDENIKSIPEKDIFFPVFDETSQDILGFIHSKEADQLKALGSSARDILISPYYVPESTSLFAQLKQFQKTGNEIGMVVDEYGNFTGIVTLEDLIEQIIGRLNQEEKDPSMLINDDLSVTADGSTTIRELNTYMSWDLPEDGQKTISGLITDELDMIPTANICITLGSYKLETLGIENNLIKEVKVSRVSEDSADII